MNLVSKFTKFINITFANFCRTISFCHYLPEKKKTEICWLFFLRSQNFLFNTICSAKKKQSNARSTLYHFNIVLVISLKVSGHLSIESFPGKALGKEWVFLDKNCFGKCDETNGRPANSRNVDFVL